METENQKVLFLKSQKRKPTKLFDTILVLFEAMSSK